MPAKGIFVECEVLGGDSPWCLMEVESSCCFWCLPWALTASLGAGSARRAQLLPGVPFCCHWIPWEGAQGVFVLCCWHLPLLPSLCCTPGSQWGSAAAQPAALCLWDRTHHISGIPVPANTLIPSVETPALQWWETFQICHITYGKKSPPVANCCAQRLLGVWSQNSINLWG